ncbi:MAG: hypothetical protein MJ149_02970, partial [Clostridia bacterium]|nr:hypothetical protein [Clostridia bacterium]
AVDNSECTEEDGTKKYSALSHRNKEITKEGKRIRTCFKGQEESNGIIKRYVTSAKEVENYLYNLQETIEWRKCCGLL